MAKRNRAHMTQNASALRKSPCPVTLDSQMTQSRRRKGVRLEAEGQCSNGHTLLAKCPSGRTTWTTSCPRKDCGLPVTIRRLPRTGSGGPQ